MATSSTTASVLDPILRSPRMIEYVEQLQAIVEDEAARRERFYDEITPEMKAEFINGEIVVHPPARSAHTEARGRISALLNVFVSINKSGKVYDEKTLCVFPRNDYEPDVVFFLAEKARRIKPSTMKFPVPDLVVEVLSDSTERLDRGLKYRDYEAHGVSEYWIVDCDSKTVEQYQLKDGSFELVLKSSKGEIESSVVKGFSVAIAAFFDAERFVDETARFVSERKKK